MIELAEFGRAKARRCWMNLHKVEGSRRLMGRDYDPKCACCRDASESLWRALTRGVLVNHLDSRDLRSG